LAIRHQTAKTNLKPRAVQSAKTNLRPRADQTAKTNQDSSLTPEIRKRTRIHHKVLLESWLRSSWTRPTGADKLAAAVAVVADVADAVASGRPPGDPPAMPTIVLTDLARNLWVDHWSLGPADLADGDGHDGPRWSIEKRTLRGGRRDGVDLIHLDNGALALSIVPTRGMGLWQGHAGSLPIGWRSPVGDGPVNPKFVELGLSGGIGWVDGFDEMMVRCGLEHNGAPFEEGGRLYPLHGRIANLPAHHVAVHVDDRPPHAITVEGIVDEARLFGPRIRMTSRVTTVPGSNRATVRDSFVNLGDRPTGLQVLYHWNFGPPWLEEGGVARAPASAVAPRDARAVEGIDGFDTYGPPEPGFAEQVYFFELIGDDGRDGRTLVLLRDRKGEKGLALRFATAQLPCFTLWKNTGGLREGYVTGLEPGTNYPNPRPVEAARGRVISLKPDEPYVTETEIEVVLGTKAVQAVEAEIEALQRKAVRSVHRAPVEPFSAV
jgi:hypothetical protein